MDENNATKDKLKIKVRDLTLNPWLDFGGNLSLLSAAGRLLFSSGVRAPSSEQDQCCERRFISRYDDFIIY